MVDSSLFQESGFSLLMIAVRENRLSAVDRLLELGGSPSERTKVRNYSNWKVLMMMRMMMD